MDASSNIYMVAYNFQTYLYELDRVTLTGTVTRLYQFPEFDNASAMVLDASGTNIYFAGAGVGRFNISSGQLTTVATLPFNSNGIALDPQGNLYVTQIYTNSSNSQNAVVKISPAGVVTPFASNFDNPQGLALDQAGNLYVAEDDPSPSLGKIAEVSSTGQQTTIASGLYHPDYVATQLNLGVAAPPADTPVLPPWALALTAALLFVTGTRSIARCRKQ